MVLYDNSAVYNNVSGLWKIVHRSNAYGCVPILLGMSLVPGGGTPRRRGLLCLLFIRIGALPTGAEGTAYRHDRGRTLLIDYSNNLDMRTIRIYDKRDLIIRRTSVERIVY